MQRAVVSALFNAYITMYYRDLDLLSASNIFLVFLFYGFD